jgi:hypothetical protein
MDEIQSLIAQLDAQAAGSIQLRSVSREGAIGEVTARGNLADAFQV